MFRRDIGTIFIFTNSENICVWEIIVLSARSMLRRNHENNANWNAKVRDEKFSEKREVFAPFTVLS